MKYALRAGPWVLAALAALVVLAAPLAPARGVSGQAATPQLGRIEGDLVAPASPNDGRLHANAAATPDPDACTRLADLSAQAAALTGSLALVDSGERPARAALAAGRVRALVGPAAGSPLAGALTDLADSLEQYAAGDPAALAGVREASARNARLREQFQTCGGRK